MFFPVPTKITGGPSRRVPPLANSLLIAVNVFCWGFGVSANWGVGAGSSPITILTYAFVHAGPLHLLANMWVLYLFGNAVNHRIGNTLYLVSYLGIAILLGLFARIFSSGLLIGASGAIYGVIAMATLLLAGTRVVLHYVAVFPVTLLVGLACKPRHGLDWILRWDHFSFRTLYAIALVPFLEIWGLWRWWSLLGVVSWTHLGHLFGFFVGIAAVLCLPLRVSMRMQAMT
ncbi:MAG: rhomboid family intramembrane serine protease [Planctomycetaceae bacterium]